MTALDNFTMQVPARPHRLLLYFNTDYTSLRTYKLDITLYELSYTAR
jgi:hypothetical protein